jgi:hypothetical protein
MLNLDARAVVDIGHRTITIPKPAMLPRHSHGSSSGAAPSNSASGSVSNSANFYLGLLVAQNTSKTLILRHAVSGKPEFIYSAAVLATESLKALLSVLWVLSHGGSFRGIVAFLRDEWRIFVRVLVPAGVYNCQQMLEFVALSRLDAPVFSVLVQTKLLTTALFSYLLLRKQLARKQVHAAAHTASLVGVVPVLSSSFRRPPGRVRRRAPLADCCTHPPTPTAATAHAAPPLRPAPATPNEREQIAWLTLPELCG